MRNGFTQRSFALAARKETAHCCIKPETGADLTLEELAQHLT